MAERITSRRIARAQLERGIEGFAPPVLVAVKAIRWDITKTGIATYRAVPAEGWGLRPVVGWLDDVLTIIGMADAPR